MGVIDTFSDIRNYLQKVTSHLLDAEDGMRVNDADYMAKFCLLMKNISTDSEDLASYPLPSLWEGVCLSFIHPCTQRGWRSKLI